jgi:pimeloyl-ACP methyl ester carboxylesterase
MGLAAYAVDLRGRGNSDGERFYVDNFEDYVSGVEAVMAIGKSRETGLPVFLLGHSAGGVILSTINRHSARRPLESSGSMGRRNRGASVGSVVNAHTVIESVMSKRSS